MSNRDEIIEAVSKMQSFMEENLTTEITIKDLARCCNYSPWYAPKIFKEVVGITPFEYLRKLRLTKAAEILNSSNDKVLDVALSFTFDSHEGFTRAFSKTFGVSPKKYSKNPTPIKLFIPYDVRFNHIRLKNNSEKEGVKMETKTIFTQVIERPKRKLILKRGITANNYFDYCDEVGCEVWGILSSIKEATYEPIAMWLPSNMVKMGTSVYAMGVEVPFDYSGEVPDGFDIINLEACLIMIFQGEPYQDENFQEEIIQVQNHIKKFDPTIYGYQFDEKIAPSFQMEPQGYRGYIEGKPVRIITK